MPLSECINRQILATVSPRQRLTDNILARLRTYEEDQPNRPLTDEQLWTMLFVYGFGVVGQDGLIALARALTGVEAINEVSHAWLEMLPMPPRQGVAGDSESNSEIDLAIGDLAMRGATISGIAYSPPQNRAGWACLIEAKWLSDISCSTAYDPERNQMARVIETALTLQGDSQAQATFPGTIYFTLLTPQRFRRANSGARLYAYKFREYEQNRTILLSDIQAGRIPIRQGLNGWMYPNLQDRIAFLSLCWVTYEELLAAMPESVFKTALVEFIRGQEGTILDLVFANQ